MQKLSNKQKKKLPRVEWRQRFVMKFWGEAFDKYYKEGEALSDKTKATAFSSYRKCQDAIYKIEKARPGTHLFVDSYWQYKDKRKWRVEA